MVRFRVFAAFVALLSAAVLSAEVKVVDVYERNGRPILIPEVRNYAAAGGVYELPKTPTVAFPAGEELILEQLNRELARFGVAVSAATGNADIRFVVTKEGVPDNDEGYALTVSRGGITVASRTAAGLFYGAQTLRNLLRNASKPELKCCRIDDFPDFKTRAYIMGINVIPPEQMHHVLSTVDALAALKVNTLFLMLAESFPYKNNPFTLRKYGYTREQIVDDMTLTPPGLNAARITTATRTLPPTPLRRLSSANQSLMIRAS